MCVMVYIISVLIVTSLLRKPCPIQTQERDHYKHWNYNISSLDWGEILILPDTSYYTYKELNYIAKL